MGSREKRLWREFTTHVDSIMDFSAKRAAREVDPDWKVKAYHRWLGERDDVFVVQTPPPLSGFALECEMRSIIEQCEGILEHLAQDTDRSGVAEVLDRIRRLPA